MLNFVSTILLPVDSMAIENSASVATFCRAANDRVRRSFIFHRVPSFEFSSIVFKTNSAHDFALRMIIFCCHGENNDSEIP